MWSPEARAASAAARAANGGSAHQHGVRAALGPHPEMLTALGRASMQSKGSPSVDRTDRMYYGGAAGAAKSYGTGIAGFY